MGLTYKEQQKAQAMLATNPAAGGTGLKVDSKWGKAAVVTP